MKQVYEVDVLSLIDGEMYRDRFTGHEKLAKKNVVSTIRDLLEERNEMKCEFVFLFYCLGDDILFSFRDRKLVEKLIADEKKSRSKK
jgi:hypothetical protein